MIKIIGIHVVILVTLPFKQFSTRNNREKIMVLKTNRKPKKVDYSGCFFDKRLEKRGENILTKMIEKETAIMNQWSNTRAELVGASRFFQNHSVTEEALIKESSERCKNAVVGRPVLAIQDTTEINYQSHRGQLSLSDEKLGPVGNNKDIGFFLHPVLVLDRENAFPLGIANIHIWNRHWNQKTKKDRAYKSQPIEKKESYRWLKSSEMSQQILSDSVNITIVADREGDIYEEFVNNQEHQTHLVIRSLHDRKLYESDEKLFEHFSSLKVMGSYDLALKKGQQKRTKRVAKMTLKYQKVKIARPSHLNKTNYPTYVELYAIEARESSETIPEGEEGVLWRILTTHEINDFSTAVEVIYWYSLRWRIEELFRTLKSQGLDVESSQLETGVGLRKLVVMALNAALIIMQLVGDRDGQAAQPGHLIFSDQELDCLTELRKKYEGKTKLSKNPFQKSSLAWSAWIIGRIGGWKGYRKAGPAGPITMKRGLLKFSLLFQGWILGKALE